MYIILILTCSFNLKMVFKLMITEKCYFIKSIFAFIVYDMLGFVLTSHITKSEEEGVSK